MKKEGGLNRDLIYQRVCSSSDSEGGHLQVNGLTICIHVRYSVF